MFDSKSKKFLCKKDVWGWALYDWANSTFSTTVMAGFFPVFFKQYYSVGVDPLVSTAKLGFANTLGILLIAITGPILGCLADRGGFKKRFLFTFCFLGAVATALLFFPSQGEWGWAAFFYVIASLAHASSFAFYDALLPAVASDDEVHEVSALGYAVGYLGGGFLFALNIWMYQSPSMFGLPDGATAIKVSFVMVGVWWLLFTLPLMKWVKEPIPSPQEKTLSVLEQIGWGLSELKRTLTDLRHYGMVMLFLAGFFFYNDGVGTTIRMAIDYGLSIGIKDTDLILALLIVQFTGFPAAILYGKVASRFSAKNAILFGLSIYAVVIIWAARMTAPWEFFALAIIIGLVQGGVQSVSRSFFAQMIPRERAGEFFGLYNLMGRFSGLLGPVLVGMTGLWFHDARLGILSLLLLFGAGAGLLSLVRSR